MLDPIALASWANAITVSRLLLSPLVFLAIQGHPEGSWVAFALWVVLCASDAFDGWVARRRGPSRSGAFLDPLADKVLVLGAMFTLVANGVFWIVPVLIIAAREFIVSVYRSVVGARGVSVPASRLAKRKTLVQQIAVGFAIAPTTAVDASWIAQIFLWLAVVLALVSGYDYLRGARAQQPAAPVRMAS